MHYEIIGRQDPKAPVILLSAGLGGHGAFWRPQLAMLAASFRVIIYDQAGTGMSQTVLPEGYSLRDMAEDVVKLLDKLAVERCFFIGHALGGIIGLELALAYPARIERLIVVNGWLKLDAHTRRCFELRMELLRNCGEAAYIRAQSFFLYPADWLSARDGQLRQEHEQQVRHFQGSANLQRRLSALMAADFTHRLAALITPVLVMSSRDDMLVPWPCSRLLAAALPCAELIEMTYGGHAMSVSNSEVFNDLLADYLKRHRN